MNRRPYDLEEAGRAGDQGVCEGQTDLVEAELEYGEIGEEHER